MLSLPLAPPLLAALAPQPEFVDSLVFQLNGLVVVFLALCSIWGLVELIGLYFKRAAAQAAKAPVPAHVTAGPAPVPAIPAASAAEPVGIDPNILTIIAAAVHATVGGRHRVRAISTGEMHIEWAQEGRRQIFASHKVR